MTREEAIKLFNTVLAFGRVDAPAEEIRESIRLAIQALEQETCETCVYYCSDGYCRHASLTIAEVEQ